AGRYPVHAETIEELERALASGPLPSLRSMVPDVPPEFAEAIDRALDRNPARRFATADDMERALRGALTSAWLEPERVVAPPAPRPETKPGAAIPRTIVWATAAVVLAAVIAGEWWTRRSTPPAAAVPLQFTLQLPPHQHLKQFANVVVS